MNKEIRNSLILNGLWVLITLFIHNWLLISLFGFVDFFSYL
jgi:hypothetical protein